MLFTTVDYEMKCGYSVTPEPNEVTVDRNMAEITISVLI